MAVSILNLHMILRVSIQATLPIYDVRSRAIRASAVDDSGPRGVTVRRCHRDIGRAVVEVVVDMSQGVLCLSVA